MVKYFLGTYLQWELNLSSVGTAPHVCRNCPEGQILPTDIYFLAMRLPKNEFIGTAAWLFFIINIFKLPFHIFVWKTVTVETIGINLILIPGIVIGFFMGVKIVKLINNSLYRKFIFIATALGAFLILFK